MWLKQVADIVRVLACAFVALALGVAASTATAAKVYRCGNAFQDQPCATDKETDTRPAGAADKAKRDVAPAPALLRTAAPAAPAADRIVLDAPRSVAVDVRR